MKRLCNAVLTGTLLLLRPLPGATQSHSFQLSDRVGSMQDTVILVQSGQANAEWEVEAEREAGIRPYEPIVHYYWPAKRDDGWEESNGSTHRKETVVIENINYQTSPGDSQPAQWVAPINPATGKMEGRGPGKEEANIAWEEIQRHMASWGERDESGEQRRQIKRLAYYPTKSSEVKKTADKPETLPLEAITDIEAQSLQQRHPTSLHIENLHLYPNPGDGLIQVSFDSPRKGRTQLSVFDVTGKRIYNSWLGMVQGSIQKQLDLRDQPSGMYFLTIAQDGQTLTRKLMLH